MFSSLSHGYQTPTKKISAVSKYFDVLPYRLDENTGLIDYDNLEKLAKIYRPKLLVSGASAYSRLFDFERLRKIADMNQSYFLYDMAHVSGLIAAGVIPSPFDHADIVTTTTHKSLRGPRGSMIFYRKGIRSVDKKGNQNLYDLESRINASVFPGHQGGPHNHTITALAVALKQAMSPEFKEYQQQVLINSKRMANGFLQRGYDLVSGGTDNHLILVDLRSKGVDGAKVERVLELCNIAVNKNTVPGDKSAMIPGGIRLGTPAATTRGMCESDMDKIVEFVDLCVQLAVEAQTKTRNLTDGKSRVLLKDFQKTLSEHYENDLSKIRQEVVKFAQSFPAIGFDERQMLYKD